MIWTCSGQASTSFIEYILSEDTMILSCSTFYNLTQTHLELLKLVFPISADLEQLSYPYTFIPQSGHRAMLSYLSFLSSNSIKHYKFYICRCSCDLYFACAQEYYINSGIVKDVNKGNSKNSTSSGNGYICDTCIGVELKK